MTHLYTLRRILSALFLLMLTTMSWAYDFEVDGIYYNFDKDSTNVSVTRNSSKRYSGDIVIPSTVSYEDKTYIVTSIGDEAFQYCSSLTFISIPEGVTSIGDKAFYSCSSLTSISIPESVTSIGESAFYGCSSLKSIEIPNSVTDIGDKAFYSCSSLTSISIPESVTSIGESAFYGCSSLKSIEIPNSVTDIGNYAFRQCSSLESIEIPNSVTNIGWYTFSGCSSLIFVIIPNSVTSIREHAFEGCTSLTSIEIPNSVMNIDWDAFSGCSSLTEVTLPDNTTIGRNTFDKNVTIKVKRGSKALLSLWNCGYEPDDVNNGTKLVCPILTKVASTQTSITMKADNLIDEYNYYIEYSRNYRPIYIEVANGEEYRVEDLYPQTEYKYYLYIYMGDRNSTPTPYYVSISYPIATDSISPNIKLLTSASSIRAIGTYIEGDAQVIAQNIKIYNDEGKYVYDLIAETDEGEFLLSGLDPQRKYTFQYTITVDGNNKYYSPKISERTSALSLTTSQPKVVSLGNVIVAAETNLDDEETNVGFEWRRIDWSNDFASNTGGAYLYEGTMEGYIRNLNTEQLWKFRPYYLSNSGTYYYGDWVGLDPSNTSYFEPTVHTYATINIEGNTALVKGYALTGTDKVTVQGFKYWKSAAMTRALSAVPTDAMTVEASGQVMTASLTGLEYNSTYHYVAFVTTSEGDTFYGEEQVFATGEDPTGIEEVYADLSEQEPATVVARYNIRGERISAPQKGLNILRMSDGSTKKVFVK